MKISVEITLAPFEEKYKDKNKKFILSIRESGFTFKENPLSTEIYRIYFTYVFFN